MGTYVHIFFRAVRSGARACPDLTTAALAVVLNHPGALETFALWAADQIASDIFTLVFWAALTMLAAWMWRRLPAQVRRALVEGRDSLVSGGPRRVEGMISPVADRGSEDFYTPAEAERLLARTDKPVSERRIRQMLQEGDLEGRKDDRGRWHVAQHEVHRLMQERRQITPEAPSDGPQSSPELLDRVLLEREIGRLQGRLELTERTESTMREERERLSQLLEEERAERRRLQEALDQARQEAALRAAWWRRMFGGR